MNHNKTPGGRARDNLTGRTPGIRMLRTHLLWVHHYQSVKPSNYDPQKLNRSCPILDQRWNSSDVLDKHKPPRMDDTQFGRARNDPDARTNKWRCYEIILNNAPLDPALPAQDRYREQ